jgi:hypothetical protein
MQAMMEKMMKDWTKNFGGMNDWTKNFDGLNYFGTPGNMDFMKDMNLSKLGHQLIDGQKTLVDNTYEMIMQIQEQTDKVADSVMKAHALIPGMDLKILEGWRDMVKKGQMECKKAIDEGFKQSEALLDSFGQSAAPVKETGKAPKAPKTTKK